MFGFFRKRRINKYIEKALAYVHQNFVQPTEHTETTTKKIENAQYCLKTTWRNELERRIEAEDKKDSVRYSISKEQTNDILHDEQDNGDCNMPIKNGNSQYTSCDAEIRYSFSMDEDKGGKILYSSRDDGELDTEIEKDRTKKSGSGVMYSLETKSNDKYNPSVISRVLKNCTTEPNCTEMIKVLEKNVNQTFVERMLYFINLKGVRDSEVYKAAQVDKRLFSKMVSNKHYKPAKDTAIALAMALELSLDDANDLLSRAGYTFSHSSKRDIIIEYFFREKLYKLIDVNEVLYNLNEKIIGKF